MFSQLSEQVKKSSQPVSDLFAANVKALQAVSDQQTAYVSGVLTDSMKLMQTVGQQTEGNGFLAAQCVYAESIRERLTAASKSTFGTLNEIGQHYADTIRTSFESTQVKEAAPTVVAKKAVAKKTTAKKAAPAKTATNAKVAAKPNNSDTSKKNAGKA